MMWYSIFLHFPMIQSSNKLKPHNRRKFFVYIYIWDGAIENTFWMYILGHSITLFSFIEYNKFIFR